MRIKDLEESEIKVGMRIKGLVTGVLGTIVSIDTKDDGFAWIKWDNQNAATSGFYGNDCECEIVEINHV